MMQLTATMEIMSDEATNQTFGERLRAAMQRRGVRTQRQLADASETDITYINRLLNGRIMQPQYETVLRLAQALDVPIGDLVPEYAPPTEDEGVPTRTPVPAAFTDAFSEMAGLSDGEIVAYVESKPGRYHRDLMARERARRSWPSYVRFCRNIFRAWTSSQQLALETAESAAGNQE